jgi:hypothetical protein
VAAGCAVGKLGVLAAMQNDATITTRLPFNCVHMGADLVQPLSRLDKSLRRHADSAINTHSEPPFP